MSHFRRRFYPVSTLVHTVALTAMGEGPLRVGRESPDEWSDVMRKNSLAPHAAIAAAAPTGVAAKAVGDALLRAVARLRAAWAAYCKARAINRRARETVDALMALDSRQLRDIGLTRSEILSAVYAPEQDRRLDVRL